MPLKKRFIPNNNDNNNNKCSEAEFEKGGWNYALAT